MTEFLRPTPMEYVPVLANIAPVELCRREATLFLTCRTVESSQLLYPKITAPEQEQSRRLKSRLPFVSVPKGLLAYLTHLKIKAAERAEYSWNFEWSNDNIRLHKFIPNVSNSPLEIHL